MRYLSRIHDPQENAAHVQDEPVSGKTEPQMLIPGSDEGESGSSGQAKRLLDRGWLVGSWRLNGRELHDTRDARSQGLD